MVGFCFLEFFLDFMLKKNLDLENLDFTISQLSESIDILDSALLAADLDL